MTIKDTLKVVEDKLEADLKQPQSFTLPKWVWFAIGFAVVIIAVVAFHG